MHESLVSGDDCTEVKKKRSKAKKEGKRDGAEEENGERWKRVRRSAERDDRREGWYSRRREQQGNERRGARRKEGKACLRKPTSDCIK